MKTATMGSEPLVLFALNASRTFGEAVAAKLGLALAAHEEREFEGGEHKSRPLVNVRGRDVFVIQSLYSDGAQTVNDKLCRLLFFAATLKDASAAQVTAVIPYFAYARKDRRTQPRDPVTMRYMATLIEAIGVDRVVGLEVHNVAAFQNAFRCPAEHLDANRLFVEHLALLLAGAERVAVVSPDVGGVKRAERFRQALAHALKQEPAMAFVEKARAKGVLSFGRLVGEVQNATAVVIDDLISTGSTLANAASACKAQGAKVVYALATHGLFVGDANRVLASDALDKVIVTDSVPPFRLDPKLVQRKVVVLSVAGLFAEAIKRIHSGGSLVELLHTESP